jgi:hypothetical protein
MSEKPHVTICIGTVGSPTFDKCKKIVFNLYEKDPRVKRIVIIRGKEPQSAWLNAMRFACKDTKWCLQVDEDMYLYKNALDELLKFAKTKEAAGVKILNASSLLFDIFLNTNIGSLKLWNSKAIQQLEFRDKLGGDRDYAKRAGSLGFSNIEIKKVLGRHDSAPTPEIAFKKYFEYTQKLRKFSGEKSAINFSLHLKKKWNQNPTYINKKAYDGSIKGLRDKIANKSKRK